MEDEVPPSEDSDDVQGPSQDHEEQTDGLGPDLPQDAGIPPPRAIGMKKAMQLAGGDDYIQAALDADKRLGTYSVPLKLYTERTGGAARRERLKRKASDITRSECESFAFCTSRTTSIEDTAILLSAFANVSDILKCLKFDAQCA